VQVFNATGFPEAVTVEIGLPGEGPLDLEPLIVREVGTPKLFVPLKVRATVRADAPVTFRVTIRGQQGLPGRFNVIFKKRIGGGLP
jgi:hypothetical protein